jgi:uncharacterized protein YndB with AHSA1/START domain
MTEPMDASATPAIPIVTDDDLFITRAFDAPRDVVWKFFTEPEFLAQWFGPVGVHVDPASVAVELHEGGRWDLDMVDDETDQHYPIRMRLTVVTPPEYLEGVMNSRPPGDTISGDIILRMWFHDHGAKTRLTLHQGPFGAEFRDMTGEGWELSFTKIDQLLEGTAS